jgi:hypothetical protein
MKTILTIAKWEVLRLKSRFGGKSRVVIFPVLLLAIVLSFTIYHQDFNLSKGIYTIGIESGGPIINDSRFNTITLDSETGKERLKTKTIDLYLEGNAVLTRDDDRSQYAAGALKKYLENLELNRIAGEYAVNQAFPLRMVISYLDSPEASGGSVAEVPAASTFSSEKAGALSTSGSAGNPPAGVIPETTAQAAPVSDLAGRDTSTGSLPSPVAKPSPVVSSQNSQAANPLPSRAAVTPSRNVDSSPALNQLPLPNNPGDSIVSSQLEKWQSGGKLPEFKAQFTSENEVIIPSLMTPPMPLAQVIIAFLYVIPMFFISVFFTSSFTEEKVNRKLVILLSSPVTRLQVIFGKMLPYYVYSVLVIIGVTIFLKGNLLLALAIFLPVMLFVFSIYLMVALTYRTFKDQTFFSVLALSVITVYLVVPAMFAGVSDLSYASPLTLAVQMYRGESFSISQYLIATLPLYLIFFLAIYIGRRVFNEEFLMGFKPLRIKVVEAIYLSLNQQHLKLSIFILSLLIIPVVFAFQLVSIVIVSNLPVAAILWVIMLVSVVIEEIAKSVGIYSLIQHQLISGKKQILILSGLSALGFWAGEKLLLLLAANMSAESNLVSVFLGSGLSGGWLFILPLVLHFVSTFMVSTVASHGHKRSYFLGIVCGTAIHAIYNFGILFATGAFR